MSSHAKRRSTKAGLPPGTLVHIGAKKTATAHITLLDYDANGVRESRVTAAELSDKLKHAHGIKWVNLHGLSDISAIEQIGTCFNLHPLVLEDIINTDQRPKLEDYGDYLYVVLKTFDCEKRGGEERISSEQVSLVLGKNFVLSFLETDGDQFAVVRERLHSGKGQLRKLGADFLMYSLIDAIVDGYFLFLERFDEKTEGLEAELVSPSSTRNPAFNILSQARECFPAQIIVAPARSDQFIAAGGLPALHPQYAALFAGRIRSHHSYHRVGRIPARPDRRDAGYLCVQRELPPRYNNESSHCHHDHIHAVNLD